MNVSNPEPTTPCGAVEVCDCCTPWGLGAYFLLDPRTPREFSEFFEQYWSTTYLIRVFDRLVHVGLVQMVPSGSEATYAISPYFKGPDWDDDWLDKQFADWSRAPDGPVWTTRARV